MKHFKKLFVAFLVICSVIACLQPLQASAATIKLSKKKLYLDINDTAYTLSLKKGKKKLKSVKWASTDKKVATVTKSGKVKPVGVGNAVIKATYKKKVYKCNVLVRDMNTTDDDTDPIIDNGNQDTDTSDKPGDTTPDNPVVSDVVKWSTVEVPFEGAYSYQGDNGSTDNISLGLIRKYVTFDPWPTTVAQVEYVIKNCDDPYVIAALEVVALDNYEYDGFGKYTCEAFPMWDALMSGAGLKDGQYGFCLPVVNKQGIQSSGFSMKQGNIEPAYTYASRAYLYGATPENQYTPMVYGTNTPCLEDKTKWAIAIDQFMYCGDFSVENIGSDITSSYYRGLTKDSAGNVTGGKYITLSPHRYSLYQETAGGPKTVVEHFGGGIHIGLAWNTKYSRWVTVRDYASLNYGIGDGWSWEGGFNPYSAGMTSNNYVAPKTDDGF